LTAGDLLRGGVSVRSAQESRPSPDAGHIGHGVYFGFDFIFYVRRVRPAAIQIAAQIQSTGGAGAGTCRLPAWSLIFRETSTARPTSAVLPALVLFELAPNGHGGRAEKVLHKFLGKPGAGPHGSPVFDSLGHLYGTTRADGHTAFGSVFEITP
jgi:hypothetical protein